jgi:voltage-gated sodium channel
VSSRAFRGTVLAAIVAGAVIVGLETTPGLGSVSLSLLEWADRIVLGVFVLEVVAKLAAEGRRPWNYFRDPWNVFDFTVTSVCLLPTHAQFAQVLRLGRVARSLRLVTALPRLQLIVGALLRSLPSFGWITLLLLTLIYAYSVMGVFLFRDGDPERFGSLSRSMLTMFSVLTLEGWYEVMQHQMASRSSSDGSVLPGAVLAAPLFFVTFILSGTMIFLNLLVGVIVNSMSEMPENVQWTRGNASATATADRAGSPKQRLHLTEGDSQKLELIVTSPERLERMIATLATARVRDGEG